MTEDDQEPERIIPVPFEILPAPKKTPDGSFCRCRSVELCEHTRTITCSACGKVIDAFDYLAKWANEGGSAREAIKNLQIQRQISQAELDDLNRQIKNARATLKRLGAPQSEKEKHDYDIQRLNPHLKKEVK